MIALRGPEWWQKHLVGTTALTPARELDRLEQSPRVAYGFDPRASLEATKWNRPR